MHLFISNLFHFIIAHAAAHSNAQSYQFVTHTKDPKRLLQTAFGRDIQILSTTVIYNLMLLLL